MYQPAKRRAIARLIGVRGELDDLLQMAAARASTHIILSQTMRSEITTIMGGLDRMIHELEAAKGGGDVKAHDETAHYV